MMMLMDTPKSAAPRGRRVTIPLRPREGNHSAFAAKLIGAPPARRRHHHGRIAIEMSPQEACAAPACALERLQPLGAADGRGELTHERLIAECLRAIPSLHAATAEALLAVSPAIRYCYVAQPKGTWGADISEQQRTVADPALRSVWHPTACRGAEAPLFLPPPFASRATRPVVIPHAMRIFDLSNAAAAHLQRVNLVLPPLPEMLSEYEETSALNGLAQILVSTATRRRFPSSSPPPPFVMEISRRLGADFPARLRLVVTCSPEAAGASDLLLEVDVANATAAPQPPPDEAPLPALAARLAAIVLSGLQGVHRLALQSSTIDHFDLVALGAKLRVPVLDLGGLRALQRFSRGPPAVRRATTAGRVAAAPHGHLDMLTSLTFGAAGACEMPLLQLPPLFTSAAAVRSIDLSGMRHLEQIMPSFASLCPALHMIDLGLAPALREIDAGFARGCPRLQALVLDGLEKLRRIGTDFAAASGGVGMRAICLRNLPNLSSISDGFASDACVTRIVLHALPQLVTIGARFAAGAQRLGRVALTDLPSLRSVGPQFLDSAAFSPTPQVDKGDASAEAQLLLGGLPALAEAGVMFLHNASFLRSIHVEGRIPLLEADDQGAPHCWRSRCTTTSAPHAFSVPLIDCV